MSGGCVHEKARLKLTNQNDNGGLTLGVGVYQIFLGGSTSAAQLFAASVALPAIENKIN